MAEDKRWDVIIIGSGFGGAMTALKLAQAGRRVVILERGQWVDREQAWDTRQILLDRTYKSLTPFENKRQMIYPDEAVGGSSIFYGAVALRMREADFEMNSRFPQKGYVDWPLSYTDLAPYYDQAEHLLGVAGTKGADPTEPPRAGSFPQAAPAYTEPVRRLCTAAETLGLRPFPLPLAIHFGDDPAREACIQCAKCERFPCKICAKNDVVTTVLPEAIRHGVTVLHNTMALELVYRNNLVHGVKCYDSELQDTFTISAKLFVVGCGSISTTRLLIQSGLANVDPNGKLLGRYLMRHCASLVAGTFPEQPNPDQRLTKQMGIADFYYGREKRFPKGHWGMIQGMQVPPAEYIAAEMSHGWRALKANQADYQLHLHCLAEDLPRFRNHITLNPHKKDFYGLPIAQVHHRYTWRDRFARWALSRQAAKILRQAGARRIARYPIRNFAYLMGGCRMAHHPEDGVLDPYCRFFNVPNLFVVDSSFMPTATGVNPSLTIAANALRVGDYIINEWEQLMKDREPFISPIPFSRYR